MIGVLRTVVLRPLLLASLAALAGPAVSAHHGDANWDVATPFSLTGTIVEFRFINPHMQVTLDVADAEGKVTRWVAQGTSPNMLVYRGWSRMSLKPGDRVTLNGHRAKNGSAAMKFNGAVMDGKPVGE